LNENVSWSRHPRLIAILGGVGVIVGLVIAFRAPTVPLLAYWMVFMLVLGAVLATYTSFPGIKQRTRHILALGVVAVCFGLLTTQIAARRAASATHLRYNGVLIERDSSIRIGTAPEGNDIRLPAARQQLFPWVVRVTKRGARWVVEPESSVDQLRLSTGNERGSSVVAEWFGSKRKKWELGGAARLAVSGDWVAVVDAAGLAVDTLTLREADNGRRLVSRRSGEFALVPVADRLLQRYRKMLRAGVPLSALDGRARNSAPFERFVRVREETPTTFLPSLFGAAPTELFMTAAAPFRLEGPAVQSATLAFRDSALVEVKQGGVVWRFHLVEWRRTASSGRGIAMLFDRLPRKLDTPLPAGDNCERSAACAVLSIRPLPAPISYVSLGQAGFSATRFGLLGRLVERDGGFDVVLPRDSIHVDMDALRPTAVPVQSLNSAGGAVADQQSRHWVLLSASSGIAEGLSTLLLIATGIALLVWAFFRTVSSVPFRIAVLPMPQQTAVGLGVTALLGLLLARTIVGARVAFFAPYLDRGLETVVGMWISVTVVAAGLLAWQHWVPPLLTLAHSLRHGRQLATLQRMFSSISTGARHSPLTLVLGGLALGLLSWVTPTGVVSALVAAFLVLLAWFTVAWVVVFTSPRTVPIQRASEVVTVMRAGSFAGAAGTESFLSTWSSEIVLVGTCLAAAAAIQFGLAALPLVALLWIVLFVFRGRGRGRGSERVPLLAFVGPTLYVIGTAFARSQSENGSMSALVLVVFVTLVSVRIGRIAGSILEAHAAAMPRLDTGGESIALPARIMARPPATGKWLVGFLPPVFLMLMLLPLAVLDMGLFLVMLVPIGVSSYLAAGRAVSRYKRTWIPPLFFGSLVLVVISTKVLFPAVNDIRRAETHEAKAAAFDQMGRLLGVPLPSFLSEPFARAAARGIATSDQALAEELLMSATPGQPRDLLVPSIEQIWGAAAYASAGWTGAGLGRAVVGDRGVAEAVSYAENSYSVYVLAEHGALGGILLLLAYLMLTYAVGRLVTLSSTNDGPTMRATRALFVVAVLIVVVPAVYVALSNVGALPITGQNMPFLGLNAWSDVAICAGVIGMLVTGAIHTAEGTV
jgi:hypothetical protein